MNIWRFQKKNVPSLSNNESNQSFLAYNDLKENKQEVDNLSDEMPDFNEQRSKRRSSKWRKLIGSY